MDDKRWLDRSALANYIQVRVDQLPRLQRAGKLPVPSYHLGPRSPRWDRATIDALFLGNAVPRHQPSVTTEQVVAEILAGKFSRRGQRRA